MTTELIPTIADPWYETWTEFADIGMWAELRESLNLFHDLRPDHPIWQKANAEVLDRPGVGSPTDRYSSNRRRLFTSCQTLTED